MNGMRGTKALAFEEIQNFVNNPDAPELAPKHKEILKRWDFAYEQLKIEARPVVVKRLMYKFEISERLARMDVRNATLIFAPINRAESEWIRQFIIDDAMQQIKAAKAKGDMKAWEKARQSLIQVYKIDKEDEDKVPVELLGGNQYFFNINFGNKVEKIDLDKAHKLPINKRLELTEFLYQDITDADADEIINS